MERERTAPVTAARITTESLTMDYFLPMPWFRFVPVACMVSVILFSRWATRRHAARRLALETERLREGLKVELATVRQVLDDNLRLLAGEAGHVVAARSFFVLFRGTLGRMVALREEELAALLAAHAANERLESLLAIRGKLCGGGAFRLGPRQAGSAEIARATLDVIAQLDEAIDVLNGRAPGSGPSLPWKRPSWGMAPAGSLPAQPMEAAGAAD